MKIVSIALSELHIDPANARKFGRAEDPVLTASIAAHGLQTPLIVRKNEKGYGVIAGGQRYTSLSKLYPDALACIVPCVMIEKSEDAAAIEASLAENIARTEMNPVDQYRAFSALANDKDNPQSIEDIAKRFGQTVQRVRQILALGALDKSVLDAYGHEEFGPDVVRAFTMIPSHKTQKAVLAQLRDKKIHANAYNVRKAAGIENQDVAKFLPLIGRDEYEARGGSLKEDLFGTEHVLSDTALVTTMVQEAIAAKVEKMKADGWANVITEQPGDFWRYNRISPKLEPTKAEQKELQRLAELIAQNEEADDFDQKRDDEANAASDAHDALEDVIRLRGITPQMKAKSIVLVNVNHRGDALEIDVRTPPKEEKQAVAAKEKAAKEKAALPVEETISQALLSRLSDTMTKATSTAIVRHKDVALAALIAAMQSRASVVGIHPTDRADYSKKQPEFVALFKSAIKLTPAEQVGMIVEHVASALNLRSYNKGPLDHEDHVAIAEAVDGKNLNAALRAEFDAASFFDSVPKTVIAEAVREAMGEDHAVKIARMDKASAAKFATENLVKAKWLPVQLRVKSYDGPKKKAAAKKPAAKKKAKR